MISDFIKLPNGDYINLNLAEKVKFTNREDTQAIKHLVCEVHYVGDVVRYQDDDAIFIKDYFDKNHGDFIQIHELDQAVQTIGLGYAVEMIAELTNKPVDVVANHIQAVANQKVLRLSPDQVKDIREDYEQNHGKGQLGSLGLIELA